MMSYPVNEETLNITETIRLKPKEKKSTVSLALNKNHYKSLAPSNKLSSNDCSIYFVTHTTVKNKFDSQKEILDLNSLNAKHKAVTTLNEDQQELKQKRSDFKGNLIISKGKSHRIGFRDMVYAQPLVNYVDIEKFKNQDSSEKGDSSDVKNENCSCLCVIF